MERYFKLFTPIILVFVFSSCLSSKVQNRLELEVASFQTWDAGTKHRGTKVEAILVGETDDVTINKLIFRHRSTIPMIKRIDGKLFVTANFEYGTEKNLDNSLPTDKADMIIYTHKGKVYELPLKDIQRKSMKYYPKH